MTPKAASKLPKPVDPEKAARVRLHVLREKAIFIDYNRRKSAWKRKRPKKRRSARLRMPRKNPGQ